MIVWYMQYTHWGHPRQLTFLAVGHIEGSTAKTCIETALE